MLYPSVNKDIQVASLKRELYAEPPNQTNMARRKRRNGKSKLRRTRKVIYPFQKLSTMIYIYYPSFNFLFLFFFSKKKLVKDGPLRGKEKDGVAKDLGNNYRYLTYNNFL